LDSSTRCKTWRNERPVWTAARSASFPDAPL
jgi:hypothetical protein